MQTNHLKLNCVIGKGVPIPCIDNGKFYRNPIAASTKQDCGKYYQCYDNKVISFRCNSDLYFDVDRQICDFKLKVHNCEKSHGKFSISVLLPKGITIDLLLTLLIVSIIINVPFKMAQHQDLC